VGGLFHAARERLGVVQAPDCHAAAALAFGLGQAMSDPLAGGRQRHTVVIQHRPHLASSPPSLRTLQPSPALAKLCTRELEEARISLHDRCPMRAEEVAR
jgi:hypothetical protein